MPSGYAGELVKLVPLEIEKHLDNATAWINDPEITEFLLIGHFPMTRLAEQKWFEAHSDATGSEISFAIETLEGQHIGFSGLHGVDYRHGTATTGTFIGEKNLWGMGYGTDSVRVRSRYAFEVLGLRLLLSSVIDGNERSMRMQQSAGYELGGRIPSRFWKNGSYRDEVLTYLEREKWSAARPA